MITSKGFWKGMDIEFAGQLTPAIRAAAAETMKRTNALLAAFYIANPRAVMRDATSGWRPQQINSNTKGASPTSKHMTGEAVDVEDADDQLDRWLMTPAGQAELVRQGLWMEHPDATSTWSHLQIVPPRSGNRVFRP